MIDIGAGIEFYEQLGFHGEAYDDGYAWIKHCGWEWFHLRKVGSVTGNEASAYLHVDDAAAWHEAMTQAAAGRVVLGDLADTPWGKREFSFSDPAGNLIRIGSPL